MCLQSILDFWVLKICCLFSSYFWLDDDLYMLVIFSLWAYKKTDSKNFTLTTLITRSM